MQTALYEPGLGYYASASSSVGKDFITAPETSPLFAECIADFISASLPDDGKILELGPGSGKLAHGILQTLQANKQDLPQYLFLETSALLRELQQETLSNANLLEQCSWLDALPQDFSGVIIANEVLDAQPCQVFVKREQQWYQRGISIAEDKFVWQDGELANQQDQEFLQQFTDLPEGYCLEVNKTAQALVATLVEKLKQGVILLIDYGFPQRELYHPQRTTGTLMAHYQHTSSTDVLAAPGTRDITCHVDFSAMAKAGIDAVATLAGFTTQANFLLDLGITKKAERNQLSDPIELAKQSQSLQRLLMPQEMGELFKVLALSCGTPPPLPGFGLRGLEL